MDPLRRHAVNVITFFDKESGQLKNIRDVYCKKHDIAGIHRQRLTAIPMMLFAGEAVWIIG